MSPTSPYFNKAGVPLPGVTTILGRFKESGGLLHWAHRIGYEQGLNRERPDLYAARDKAGDAGTYAHALVEWHANGEVGEPPAPEGLAEDVVKRGRNGYNEFLKWERQTNMFIMSWEKPLVSEEFQFGGTPDALFMFGDLLSMGDWKTSNAVYSDNLLQLAAYTILWEENFPHLRITDGAHIVRFSKETADFEHRHFNNLENEKEMFLLLRKAYAKDLEIKKRVK